MIERKPEASSRENYDLVIIGGGIYGVCLSLEAARRGLKSVLLERNDFGGATSWNSLRILHGGLRYLQTLDLPRFFESVAERHWFCKNFPDLVRPLPCLMPLYNRGLKRKASFGPALLFNDWLSSKRNDDVAEASKLGRGRILTAKATKEIFPQVDPRGLQGGALWHDAVMVNSQRLLIEVLRWACVLGAVALNYVEARELLVESGKVVGVRSWDRLADRTLEFRAARVINCAGPWSAQVATRFSSNLPRLFHASVAFNVLIDRKPLAPTALALQSPQKNSQVYFMHPMQGGILLGTVHAPWSGEVTQPAIEEPWINQLIDEVNFSIPGFELKRKDIRRVLSGFLPASAPGSKMISRRPIIYSHDRDAGPSGLISLCGVKFTTARLVAARALSVANRSWGQLPYRAGSERCLPAGGLDLTNPDALLEANDAELAAEVLRLVREEAVTCAADLILRRTDLGLNLKDWRILGRRIAALEPGLPMEHCDRNRPFSEANAIG